MSEDPFLSRWSRLKKAAAKAGSEGHDAPPAPPARPPAPIAILDGAPRDPAPVGAASEPAPLPPVESLTPDSDFSPFMSAGVEESLKRRALKALFQDPRFNVMDGLDVYVGDYSQPDPLPAGWLEQMGQVANLGDQPARLEAERKAAEEARAAAAGSPAEARNSLPGERPATTAGIRPSDTFDPDDEAPAVGESQGKGERLT